MISTREPITETPDAEQPVGGRSLVDFLLFALVALAVLFFFATQIGGLSFETRDLVDTDGYMRYLRVEALLDGGEWFDPVFPRSNHPFGETSHWTRPLDVYVAGLTLLLTPFLGSGALYWAAVWNGPLLFLAIGATAYWAFGPYLPPRVRNLVMPFLLALPVVFLYTGLGRVDHHGAILVGLVASTGWILRLLTRPSARAAVWLGVWLGLGMWISVEFLVAVGLTALTLGLYSVGDHGLDVARRATTGFLITALVTAVAVLVERGGRWSVVELDRISIAHVGLLVATTGAFGLYARLWRLGSGRWPRLGLLAMCSAVGVGGAVAIFPDLLSGPFGMVDPEVREIWLYEVAELRPITEYTDAGWPTMVMAPSLLGLAAGVVQVIRRRKFSSLLTGWLFAYAVLSVFQVRWALFAHMLALPLLLTALAPVYDWLGKRRATVLLRPLFLVFTILAVPALVIVLDNQVAQAQTQDCRIESVVPALADRQRTTVLASQDFGPEILYRSSHDVIATPYHRNQAGILFVRHVMSMPTEEALTELATRDVGLILVCAGKEDLTHPEETEGTFYESLVEGPHPDFVTPIPPTGETDFLLFAVES